jgi:hypothetical protein
VRSNNFHLLRPLRTLFAESPADDLAVAVCIGVTVKGNDVAVAEDDAMESMYDDRVVTDGDKRGEFMGDALRVLCVQTLSASASALSSSSTKSRIFTSCPAERAGLSTRFPNRCCLIMSRMPTRIVTRLLPIVLLTSEISFSVKWLITNDKREPQVCLGKISGQ